MVMSLGQVLEVAISTEVLVVEVAAVAVALALRLVSLPV